MFYQYFTNGCGNQAMEHGVVREHMYEMETEASENIPMSHVAQPKKNRREFFVLNRYLAGFVSHRNIITVSLMPLDKTTNMISLLLNYILCFSWYRYSAFNREKDQLVIIFKCSALAI